jgi:hypothetical protein
MMAAEAAHVAATEVTAAHVTAATKVAATTVPAAAVPPTAMRPRINWHAEREDGQTGGANPVQSSRHCPASSPEILNRCIGDYTEACSAEQTQSSHRDITILASKRSKGQSPSPFPYRIVTSRKFVVSHLSAAPDEPASAYAGTAFSYSVTRA